MGSGPPTNDPAGPAPAGSAPTVAAFDFDGTLTRGGSELRFLLRLRGASSVAAAIARYSPALVKGVVLGGPSADAAKETLFVRLLAGQPVRRVEEVAAEFAGDHLRRRLRPAVHERLRSHRAQGHRVVIVSASPECYVRVAGEQLGADAILATGLENVGGRLTGRFAGSNCRGPEKLRRLEAWLRGEGFHRDGTGRPEVWAYGNSRGDLHLLGAADHGVDVGRLGTLGRLRRFPRLRQVAGDPPPGTAVRSSQPGTPAAPTTSPR
jgi:phosphatidylglycerophosphatase C